MFSVTQVSWFAFKKKKEGGSWNVAFKNAAIKKKEKRKEEGKK